MSNLPPPTMPTMVEVIETTGREVKPKRRGPIFIGLAVVAGMIGIGAVIAATATSPTLHASAAPVLFTPPPTEIQVHYTLTVFGETCSEINNGEFSGYDDIAGHEAEIFDGSGHLLGFGTMDFGNPASGSCRFTSTGFSIEPSSDGKYRATVGNVNRGFLNFTDADVNHYETEDECGTAIVAPCMTLDVNATLGS